MPIQFRCPGCSQPIEVDDPFAGKAAQCPYCRRVITVPESTSFDAAAPIEARPSQNAAMPPLPSARGEPAYSTPEPYSPTGELSRVSARAPLYSRVISSQRFGNAALICAVLSIMLLGVQVVFAFSAVAAELTRSGTSQPTQQQMQAMMQKVAMEQPILAFFGAGSMALAVAALLLGAISWKRHPDGNWRAWISVGVGGLFMLCICGSVALTIAAGASGLG